MESITRYKSMAKAMRHALAKRRINLPHSTCLEIVASQAGFSDWNVLKAACENDLSLSLTVFIEHSRQAEAVRFYEAVFDTSSIAIYSPDNQWIGFDMRVGNSVISVAGSNPRREAEPWRGGPFFPKEKGAVNVILCVTVNDAEDVLQRAVAAGATVRDKLQGSIHGIRGATFFDPFGHIWGIREKTPGHRSRF
ncbi:MULTISPECIES: glyoxalase superfamily protein [unclassified Nitrobacter]|uniref:glyoxalase superfamily protein n=1 Tax=unclassified Nitrobacter TaxID=2620411 RepID=UPI001AC574F4|nr:MULTISPECIES: glyoxalase superfamily protein [unclassified Nitrobacter]MBN9146861.1 VOC family protein [Nitrobacter sp.]